MSCPATWLRMRCSEKSGADDELREQAGLQPLDQPPGAAPDRGSPNSIAHMQPEPAHLAHDVELVDERPRQLEQLLAEPRRALDEPLLVELVQRREPGRHRELVRRERRAVADTACSIESKTASCTARDISSAPTGT